MSRISACFARLKAENKTALIPYVTAGDSNPDVTVPLMHRMVEAGADIIELGIPFSDPMADGPTIQLACERALKHHVSLKDVLEMTREFRQKDTITPIVYMGYMNPIEAMGYEKFAQLGAEAGVDGLLTVDMPPEESKDLRQALKLHDIDPIFLLSPTTQPQRIEKITAVGSGFLYYVSLKGVTGSNVLDVNDVDLHVKQIRNVSTLPIGVGFGIKTADDAAAVADVSDAVVVGSVLVKMIEDNKDDIESIMNDIGGLLTEMRVAMDS